MDRSVISVKQYLENTYDIPFHVEKDLHFQDASFTIRPQHSNKELFEIRMRIKNQLRLVVEVYPEKYAAFSINDMANASAEKKHIFSEYANQLIQRKAKVEFSINGSRYDPVDSSDWPTSWSDYRLRISRSPICSEDEQFDEESIICSWSVIIVGMLLSLLNVIKLDDEEERYEGGLTKITTNHYERNPINRELCLAANGYTCKVCGFDFEKRYGEIGHKFIHVHHIVPVSQMTESYLINPAKDLIPVCPNCHAMLHKKNPPFTPDELKNIILSIEEGTL